MKILKKLFVIFLTTLMTFSCFTIYASELNHKKSLVGYCAWSGGYIANIDLSNMN